MSSVSAQLIDRPLPPVSGSSGLTQGRYGDRGNLELVAPDLHDGFWVFWFNGDAVQHRHDVLHGSWSAGLHVPTGGRRLLSVRITQVPFGPDYLEVIGRLATTGLHRWYWTPADGFVDGGAVAPASSAEPARMTLLRGAPAILCVRGERVEQVVASVRDYPALSWRADDVLPTLGIGAAVTSADWDASGDQVVALVVTDGRGQLLRHGADGAWTPAGALPGSWLSAQIHLLGDGSAVVTGQNSAGQVTIGAISLRDPTVTSGWYRSRAPVDDVQACLSTLPAEGDEPQRDRSPALTLEVVARTGARLDHRRFSARTLRRYGTDDDDAEIHARVWA